MTLVRSFLGNPLAQAMGWTLLHSLWEGAVLWSVLAAALLPIRSARIRYATACFAMLALVAAFGITLYLQIPASSQAHAYVPPPQVASDSPNELESSVLWPPALSTIVPWLTPIWIVGVIALYVWQLAGVILVRRLRSQGVCAAADRWQAELKRLSERMHVSRPVLLLESCLAEMPVVLGHFRPVILMPVELFANLPPGQIEAILLHELAHIRRHDYMVNVLQRLVEGLLFYHPAVWWISRLIRHERENCCDDVVVSIRGNAHEYAVALAALERQRGTGREPAIAATGGSLVTRIRRLLYPRGSTGAWTPVLAASILITTLALTLAAWQASPTRNTSADSQAYASWLNQDVVYIIDDAERAAFEKLTADDERNKFIEQFWDRRNPAGGSENKFKTEHYRRIMYANGHYGMPSGTAGWRTDRGRMYIVYGPPDELEMHPPAAGGASLASEVWLYHNVAGVGKNAMLTFIDRTGRGDYRLAPGNGH